MTDLGCRLDADDVTLKTGTEWATVAVVANDNSTVATDAGSGRTPSIVLLLRKSASRRNGRLSCDQQTNHESFKKSLKKLYKSIEILKHRS